jgi:hypothetical protein
MQHVYEIQRTRLCLEFIYLCILELPVLATADSGNCAHAPNLQRALSLLSL